MIKNPLAQPGTVLAGERHLDSYRNLIGIVGKALEQERERKIQKQKGLDEMMMLPEFDYGTMFQPAVEGFMQKVTGPEDSYMSKAIDYRGKGLNFLKPTSPEEFKAYADMQRYGQGLQVEAAKLAQQKKIYDNAFSTLSDPDRSENLDAVETMNRVTLFSDPNLTTEEREAMLNDFGGSLVATIPFNPAKFEREVLGNYKTVPLGDYSKKEDAPEGYEVVSQSVGLTPVAAETAAAEALANPEYRAYREAQFNELSASAQQQYQGEDPVEAYTAEQLRINTKYEDPALYKDAADNNITIELPDQYNDSSITDPLIYQIGEIYRSPNSLRVVSSNGDIVDIQTIELPAYSIGKFKYKNSEGEVIWIDERVEAVYKYNGRWHISTNKSKHEKQGLTEIPGIYMYGLPVDEDFGDELLFRIAENSGEHNVNKILEQIKKASAWDEDNKKILWDKIMVGEIDIESEIYR